MYASQSCKQTKYMSKFHALKMLCLCFTYPNTNFSQTKIVMRNVSFIVEIPSVLQKWIFHTLYKQHTALLWWTWESKGLYCLHCQQPANGISKPWQPLASSHTTFTKSTMKRYSARWIRSYKLRKLRIGKIAREWSFK